jgi:hypothetical protein
VANGSVYTAERAGDKSIGNDLAKSMTCNDQAI